MKKFQQICTLLLSSAVALSASTAFSQPAQAAKKVWTIDQEHSQVKFKVKSMMLKTVSGQFDNFFGTVDFDGDNLDAATVSAEIQTGSIDTNDAKRDRHLKTKDFFDSVVFPTMTYKSNKIIVDSKGNFAVFGTLSMHGINRNVTLQATPLRVVKAKGNEPRVYVPKNKIKEEPVERLATTAEATLDRKDFGISTGPMDRGGTMISDQVKITLDIELVPMANVSFKPFHTPFQTGAAAAELQAHAPMATITPVSGTSSGLNAVTFP